MMKQFGTPLPPLFQLTPPPPPPSPLPQSLSNFFMIPLFVQISKTRTLSPPPLPPREETMKAYKDSYRGKKIAWE